MGILEAGFASHIERAIHIRLFERGIACDSELLIHGHVALEVRCISHDQRARVHSASLHACAFQLAFRSHITKVIDSHIAFDRSFVSNVIAFDSGGALIGVSDSVTIGLNVICIGLDLLLEVGILRFEVSNIALSRCHFAIQRCDIFSVLSDFPFQCGVSCFEVTNVCFICANLTFCGSKPSIEISISFFSCCLFFRDLILKLRLCG